MKLLSHLFLLVAISLGTSSNALGASDTFARGSTEDETAVAAQTHKILDLLDAGDTGKAWDDAAKPLQQQTSRATFVAGTKSLRKAVGDVEARTLDGIGFAKDLEDAPPGRYAGVFVRTTFSTAGVVEEKIILLNQGGRWLLAGYFLKKRRSAERPKKLSVNSKLSFRAAHQVATGRRHGNAQAS
jgi:Protein of unknown function (DUF4019)